MDDIRKILLRKFNSLCKSAALSEYETSILVCSYGTDDIAQVSTHDLVDICDMLTHMARESKRSRLHKLRKQATAAITDYLVITDRKFDPQSVKEVACRMAGHKEFNKIPPEQLRELAARFTSKYNNMRSINVIAESMAIVAAYTPQTENFIN